MNGAQARASALALVCLGAIVGQCHSARADDLTKEQCIAANESAQELRHKRKLRAARTQLQICLARSCPGPVRDDCAERLKVLEQITPTVIFVVTDPGRQVVQTVGVTMDGARIADRLDGSPLFVDPGEHVFSFSADGFATVTKRLVVRETVKAQNEVIRLRRDAPKEAPPTAPAQEEPTLPTRMAAPSEPRANEPDRRTIAYAVGGAGVAAAFVGAALGVSAKLAYDDATSSANCPRGPSACNAAGVDGVESAHAQATASTIAFVGAALLLGAGLVIWSTTSKTAAAAGSTRPHLPLEVRW